MTDKMREEFEVWYEGITGSSVEFNDCGIPVSIGSALSDTTTMGMWVAWRASRESLCVELPKVRVLDGGRIAEIGYELAVDDFERALDAAGVRYK